MDKKKNKKSGGYSYSVTMADIKKFSALPVELRLQWLEEANRFLYFAMDDEAKRIREKLRKGEI